MIHRAEVVRQRRARVRRATTRRQTSTQARRTHGPGHPSDMPYRAALGKIIKGTWALILKGYAEDIRQDDFRRDPIAKGRIQVVLGEYVKTHAPAVIEDNAQRISTQNRTEMARVIGLNPKVDPGTGTALENFRRENVRLITSVAEDQLDRVESLLASNFGLRVEDLAEKLQDEFDVTKSRANLIARDQTLKLNANLTKARHEAAGIEAYIWTTSGDERVREDHASKEGQRFRWDNPPQDTGHPGEDYQCRCIAFPILPGVDDSTEEDSE